MNINEELLLSHGWESYGKDLFSFSFEDKTSMLEAFYLEIHPVGDGRWMFSAFDNGRKYVEGVVCDPAQLTEKMLKSAAEIVVRRSKSKILKAIWGDE